MKELELRKIIREEILKEFLDDLKKQCVVLMGLPAAGKSTFVNNQIQKHIPGFKNYKISNSDNALKGLQYKTAQQHFDKIHKTTQNINDNEIKKEISKLKFQTQYASRRGGMTEIPITFEWWKANKDKGFDTWWKTFFKPYYASYFDIRDLAQAQDQKLFTTKIKESSSLIVIDTTAANSSKVISRLKVAQKNDFNNTIVYLEIDPELSVVRDKYRESTEGRGVGADLILSYAPKMDAAFKDYQNAAKSGLISRILHFKWIPSGDSPIKGTWALQSDKRYNLKKKKK